MRRILKFRTKVQNPSLLTILQTVKSEKTSFPSHKYCIIIIFLNNSLNLSMQLFAATAALRTTRGSLSACPSVCLFQLICHLLKKSSGNPYLKICDLRQHFLTNAPLKKKLNKNLESDCRIPLDTCASMPGLPSHLSTMDADYRDRRGERHSKYINHLASLISKFFSDKCS